MLGLTASSLAKSGGVVSKVTSSENTSDSYPWLLVNFTYTRRCPSGQPACSLSQEKPSFTFQRSTRNFPSALLCNSERLKVVGLEKARSLEIDTAWASLGESSRDTVLFFVYSKDSPEASTTKTTPLVASLVPDGVAVRRKETETTTSFPASRVKGSDSPEVDRKSGFR